MKAEPTIPDLAERLAEARAAIARQPRGIREALAAYFGRQVLAEAREREAGRG